MRRIKDLTSQPGRGRRGRQRAVLHQSTGLQAANGHERKPAGGLGRAAGRRALRPGQRNGRRRGVDASGEMQFCEDVGLCADRPSEFASLASK